MKTFKICPRCIVFQFLKCIVIFYIPALLLSTYLDLTLVLFGRWFNWFQIFDFVRLCLCHGKDRESRTLQLLCWISQHLLIPLTMVSSWTICLFYAQLTTDKFLPYTSLLKNLLWLGKLFPGWKLELSVRKHQFPLPFPPFTLSLYRELGGK